MEPRVPKALKVQPSLADLLYPSENSASWLLGCQATSHNVYSHGGTPGSDQHKSDKSVPAYAGNPLAHAHFFL